MTRVRHFTAQRSSDTYHSNENENRDKLRKIKSSPCSFSLQDTFCGVWPSGTNGRGQGFPLPNIHQGQLRRRLREGFWGPMRPERTPEGMV